MEATVQNLLKVYPKLPKKEKGRIIRMYSTVLERNGDTFKRRIDAGEFPKHEAKLIGPELKSLFPKGFTVTEPA